MLADFHFLRPLWLLAVVPVLIFSVLLYYYRREHSPWHNLIAPHLQGVLLGGHVLLKKQPFALPLLLLCWLLTALALAGPSWQKLPQPAFALKKATVLVVDMSLSMRATDMAPDRLTQLRFAALDFTEQLKEGELALLSFAGDAFVISPLTPDHNNIRLLIPDLKPEIMPAQGSDLASALQQADKLLRQAGYPQGDVVVFTDGFDRNSYRQIQDLLGNWPHRLSIVGFGSDEGAPVKLESGELLKNAQGAVVIPKVPHQQLAELTRGGGIYRKAGISGDALTDIVNLPALSALQQADQSKQIQGDQWQDNAIYLVWLLLPLLLLQRKYSNLLSIGALLLLPSYADAVEWRDLWQTKQQQAKQDYAAGDYSAAQQKFTDPLWQGNAAYRSGDYSAAEQAFRQAAEQHPGADALHNLGNALAQQQRYDEALAAYQQALQLDNDFSAAQQNAALMQQLLQQQQEQEQQQQQNSQQKNNQDQQQQQNSDGESQSDESGDSEAQSDSDSQSDAQQQTAEQQAEPTEPEQQAAQPVNEAEQQDGATEEQQLQAIKEAWPNATPEEQQQLDNLLRKVQDDPALLLRNKMYLEYLKRQQQRLPKGVEQQW